MWNLTTDITQDDAWAAAIATWGQMMRQSKFTTGMNFDDLMKLAKSGKGKDPYGYRAEAIQWMETWQDLGPAKSSDGLPRWDESKR
jgi:Ca-activated chloride channel family protein